MLYETFELYQTPDKIYVIPTSSDGGQPLSNAESLVVDRITNELRSGAADEPIPVQAEQSRIYGIIGVIRLVSGPYLLTITGRELIGRINDHKIWKITQATPVAFTRTTMHLTEREMWFNRHFLDMLQLVLKEEAYYYSTTFDLTHSLQRLDNTTPEFRQMPLHERADDRFMWNRAVLKDLMDQPTLFNFALPIMHGFVGIRQCRLNNGKHFTLSVISRRSIYRVGPRFLIRGIDEDGHAANFVETEQIVEYNDGQRTFLCSFVQTRGSIPLVWNQSPNLRWQPMPLLLGEDDIQSMAYRRHFEQQTVYYQNARILIVNLVNQTGRETRVGEKFQRIAEHKAMATDLPNVQYYSFDFHKYCKNLNWDRLSILQTDLQPNVKSFGFFATSPDVEQFDTQVQTGCFRTNCMDCLDRTNVVQSLLAKQSLVYQLVWLGVLDPNSDLNSHQAFDVVFKNLWADNGDLCSVQYAGTPALKADFTRSGKRTPMGALNDARNAITRYVKNNFLDGYRQDAYDLFLGEYQVDRTSLPENLATGPLDQWDWRMMLALAALFSFALAILSFAASTEHAIQWFLFWMAVFLLCFAIIVVNGPEFVNKPKLKRD